MRKEVHVFGADVYTLMPVHRREKRGLLSCKPWVWEGN